MIKKLLTVSALATATIASSATLPTNNAQAQQEYLGQVMLVGFNFCPRGTAEAAGQLLPISQYSALFSLYGTIYGGDGRTTFALPDLRGRSPISDGTGAGLSHHQIGQKGGSESFSITTANMPQHAHAGGAHTHSEPAHSHTATLKAGANGPTEKDPAGNSFANWSSTNNTVYAAGRADGSALSSETVTVANSAVGTTGNPTANQTGNSGGSQAIAKRSPYLTMKYCVNIQGVFPSRN